MYSSGFRVVYCNGGPGLSSVPVEESQPEHGGTVTITEFSSFLLLFVFCTLLIPVDLRISLTSIYFI